MATIAEQDAYRRAQQRRREPQGFGRSGAAGGGVDTPRGGLGRSRHGAATRDGRPGGTSGSGAMLSPQLILTLALAAFIAIFWGIGGGGSGSGAAALGRLADGQRPAFARFSTCGADSRADCVIDGGSFRMDGERIRLADADTPEIVAASCDDERDLGEAAQARLNQLLNAGPVQLSPLGPRDRDSQGRLLRVASIGGTSLGGVLIDEGLAHRPGGGHRGWC